MNESTQSATGFAQAHFPISLGNQRPFDWTDTAAISISRAPANEGAAASTAPQTDAYGVIDEAEILEHLPMVRFIAKRIHERLPQHVELEDLVSAGVLGLLDAFQKFSPSRKVQFRSYAQFRVRGAILDSLRDLDWGSREVRRKGRAVEEAIQRLRSTLLRNPSEAEIAGELGMGLSAYQSLLSELHSLEVELRPSELSDRSGEEELACVPGRPEDDPLARFLEGETKALLAAAVEALPERERLVLTLYYYEEMTMREIGLVLGVIESRISQIRSSAILHLRASLAEAQTGHAGKRVQARSAVKRTPGNRGTGSADRH